MPPGINRHEDGFTDYVTYDWENAIYDNIYQAFMTIIRELGLEAWKAARWEVYDKYAESIGSITFIDDKRAWWLDQADTWLQGKIEGSFHERSLGPIGRLRTDLGKEYNELLPKLRPGE